MACFKRIPLYRVGQESMMFLKRLPGDLQWTVYFRNGWYLLVTICQCHFSVNENGEVIKLYGPVENLINVLILDDTIVGSSRNTIFLLPRADKIFNYSATLIFLIRNMIFVVNLLMTWSQYKTRKISWTYYVKYNAVNYYEKPNSVTGI